MRLRLRPRTEDPTNCTFSPALFARLAPSVVHEIASKTPTYTLEPNQPIDFLPLSVRFEDKTTIYVSYNGGELDETDEHILDLPSCLIPKKLLSRNTNTTVEVSLLTSMQDADTLHVEPLTCEDWELLETRAQFLEDGALLQQVTVVYSGQILPIWVGMKQDFAWIRVLPENFANNSPWPSLEGVEYVRLVQNTRVVVRPKSRGEDGAISTPRLRVFPTREDYSTTTNQLAETLGKKQVSTSPGTVVVHSDTKQKLLRLGIDDTEAFVVVWNCTDGSDSREDARILQIVFSDLVPTDCIAIHFLTRTLLNVSALEDSVFVRILSPIEVARGSIGTSRTGEDFQLSLAKVDLQELRTEKKWRYPCGGNYQGYLDRPFTYETGTREDVIANLADEPVQIGSFLLVNNSNEKTCTIYQASQSANDNPRDQGSGAREKFGACFLRRHNLLQAGSSEGTPSLTAAAPDTLYQLHLRSQLLNLLPETSHVPVGATDFFSAAMYDVILYGDTGSGKTHTALLMAAVARFRHNCSTYYLDCKKLKEGQGMRMKDILAELKSVFHDAASNPGESLIILDDLDVLAPNLQESSTDTEESTHTQQVNPVAVDQAKLVGDLIKRLFELCWNRKRPVVVITCEDERSLLPCATSARLFTRKVCPVLTSSERETILWNMISPRADICNRDASESFRSFRIGRKTEGFRPRDLLLLSSKVRHAMQDAVACLPEEAASCTSKILESFMPLRQQSVEDGGAIDWSQIGGLSSAKEALISTILSPAKYRRIYERAQIRLPRGVLVFGPPGSGKSFAIPALAKKCGFALVMCRGPELLSRFIGESESHVRELFARAAASSPALLFFDEVDSLAPRRGSDRTGVTDRVVNQLLTLLDGVEDAKAKGLVYVVAATSRPDIVDPALIRPGRLEKHVYFGPPETEDQHTDLILQIASRYTIDSELEEFISTGEFVREAKAANDHFHRMSCADFKAIFDTAQLEAIHEVLRMGAMDQRAILKVHHVISAMRTTKPSLLERDHNMLMEIYRPFRKSMMGEDGNRDGASSSRSGNRGRDLRTALR